VEDIAGNAAVSVKHAGIKTAEVSITLDETAAALTFSDGTLRVLNMSLKDAKNTIQGELLWPFSHSGGHASIRVEGDCTELAASELRIHGQPLTGSLKGRIAAGVSGLGPMDFLDSSCEIQGANLHWGMLGAVQLCAEASALGKTCIIQNLKLELEQHGTVQAQGTIDTQFPYAFKASASTDLTKLEKAHAFLSQIGLPQSVGGSLKARWNGEGSLSNLIGSGDWSLQLRDARWDALKFKLLDCSGHYLPDSIITAPIRIETQDTRCSAQIQWDNASLQIQNIALEQWGYPALTGNLTLPLAYDAKGTHWVEDGKLQGKIQATKLDLSNLAAGAGRPGALHGSLDFLLELKGTPVHPSAFFKINASGLQSAEAPKFTPLSLTATGGYNSGILQSEGSILSPLDAPIEFKAKIPVQIAALFRNELGLGDLPITGTLIARNASLKVLPQILSGLRQVNGTASLDAQISGTLAQPSFTGRLEAQCAVIHFSSDRAPALGDVRARLEFTPKILHVHEFKADVGGGNLQITGNALFNEPGNPALDFSIKAKEVLTVRNRELSLRLNGDLAVRGPWKQATISGRAAAVNSRLQKDIEVLPLNVIRTGFTNERPQTTGKPWFTFQRKPFSDWRFNVALSTTPGDPILVRGNRLRGTADAEISFEGSGAAPTIHGAYRTTDLVALLPFARIEVSHGRIWYSRDQPFHPQLDFSGETEVRNTRVRLYIWGAAEAPSITARSEPPIGEVDLLTLLTTGSLPSDATENAQALAGRAAALLFQEFTDKVFAPNGRQERFSALRRFNLDVGAVNGRTGHQESRLTYRLLDDLFLIGEVGADGDFAGRLRYVLRFR
ncbi:MAG: translocation/assembly module TamB domain-containing protein, partial [Verrucomicrobiota bacterium]